MASRIDFSWLDLDIPARRQLSHQPVVLVLSAVQFYPVLKVDQREYIAAFQDAIRREFPAFDLAPLPPPIQVQMPGVLFEPTANLPPTWVFQDAKREWKITLTRDALGFETRSYPGFEGFRDRFALVLDALVAHVVPTLGTRIGLRSLDEVRPINDQSTSPRGNQARTPNVDWGALVRPELLGIAATPVFRDRIQQSLQQLALRDKHGVGINISHGIVPGGSLVEPPSAFAITHGNQPFYALDIDVFQEFAHGHEIAMNTQGILDRLDAFHEANSRIFRWSLNDEHLSTL